MYEQLKEMVDKLVYPQRVPIPKLYSNTPSIEEMEEYKNKLATYDSDLTDYKQLVELHKLQEERIYEFVKQEGGLYSIPEQYREKVWNKALEKDSYFEIYQELDELTDLFF